MKAFFFAASVLGLTTAGHLTKRCSPLRDPEYYLGYLPPVACWQDQDTACQAYLQAGTKLLLDKEHKLAVVYGVSEGCFATIAEELAREKDGRKTYGWEKKHGKLTAIGGGILVISGMSDDTVARYAALKYKADS
jgi:hypothetical protein